MAHDLPGVGVDDVEGQARVLDVAPDALDLDPVDLGVPVEGHVFEPVPALHPAAILVGAPGVGVEFADLLEVQLVGRLPRDTPARTATSVAPR